MVGVPRSKGCKNCRRKKIKCDEQRPSCGQCRKGVRECEGYDQSTIFRHSTSRDFSDTNSDTYHGNNIQFSGQPLPSVVWTNDQQVLEDKQIQKRPKKRLHRDIEAETKLKQARAKLARSPSLSRAPNPLVLVVQSITGQFLQQCAPQSDAQEAPLAWLQEIQEMEMGQAIDAMPLAMSALALGWAGCVNEQPPLADAGLQLYNAAIRQLRGDMDTQTPLQSLVVTAIFVAFELCHFGSESDSGWSTHMKGVAAFLQALGPEKVSRGPYLKVYSFCRVVFIMMGLSRRRSVCAGSQMWMYGPFRNHEKNAYHQFYDLAANACDMFGYADALVQAAGERSDVQTKQPAEVLKGILQLISKLRIWVQNFDIVRLSGPFSFPSANSVTRHRLDRARARGYPTELPSDSGWTPDTLYWQRMMHLYWAICLDLYMTIADNPLLVASLEGSDDLRALLMSDLGIVGRSEEQVPAALVREECRKLASSVAVVSTTACDSTYQYYGSLVTVYILRTAIRWYETHEGDADGMDAGLEQHCRDVLGGIRTEESNFSCPFGVSIVTDEVLRREWC
ncbi:hypothetical protein F4808DRAFT_1072 [Astrocystis sublimbata]|nr:hypothetical protein F4808DRAFT_1072 [Astrocystis sublimbata]